jgi:AraC-like DNA-binding protein
MVQAIWSGSGQPAARRIRSWNDNALASLVQPAQPAANAGEFRAIRPAPGKAPVRIAEIYSDPQLGRCRSSRMLQCSAHVHFLHLQLEGESVNRQDRREARLVPGDFTICDNSRPFEVEFSQPIRMLVLGFSDELMRRYLQYPQSIAAMPISGGHGVGAIVSELLNSIWKRCLSEKEFDIDAGVTDALLGLVAHAYRQELGSTIDHNSLAAAHRVRMLSYIEENLGDPKLTPTYIARTFRITTRYLHHLFSEEKETIAKYILRRRLEDCARALTAPTSRKRTITSIAFDHGFSSATHFGRVFRARYDLTPREYRRRHGFEN